MGNSQQRRVRAPKSVMVSAVCAVMLWPCAFAGARPGVAFMGIGDLDGGAHNSSAYGISPDGSTVLGSGTFDDQGALGIMWTPIGGMMSIGRLAADGRGTFARESSEDGSVIVGESAERAFRWTSKDGMQDLGTLDPDNTGFATANAVTSDGNIVAGTATTKTGYDAFRFKVGEGMLSDGFTGAGAMSADGRVIATFSANNGSAQSAFRVAEGKPTVALGDLPGGLAFTLPTAMTADGGAIVGYSRSRYGVGPTGGDQEAFVWREETGLVGLGSFGVGFSPSQALDISDDGSVIVGFGTRNFVQQAAIWFGGGAIVNLKQFLLDLELDHVQGWTLTSANGVSADGLTIVGTGINPNGQIEGWYARIPSPGAGVVLLMACLMNQRRRR